MPATTPPLADAAAAQLQALGQQIRAHRKALRVSAVAAAEAAGMSRVTLHRIENGEPSVTMGAYLNALAALNLGFGLLAHHPGDAREAPAPDDKKSWIPARIRLADYPQLKRIAWQVHGTDELSPAEALGLYERNSRHLDLKAMQPQERALMEALRLALGSDGAKPLADKSERVLDASHNLSKRMVGALKYLKELGMTVEDLQSLHHPQAWSETYDAAIKYFGKTEELRDKNTAYAHRVLLVAALHLRTGDDFTVLTAHAREAYPEHLS